MSKLSYLQGKPQKVKIGEIELELKPLTLDDLELFSIDANAPIEQQTIMSKKLIAKILKDAVPDATPEEINKISMEYLSDIMKAITKLNKLSEGDDRLQRIKDAIKSRQNQAKGNK